MQKPSKVALVRYVLIALIIGYVYSFAFSWVSIFATSFMLPFFLICATLLYLSFKKPSTQLGRVALVGLCTSSVIAIGLIMISLEYLRGPRSQWSFFSASTLAPVDEMNVARCAWLPRVPKDWVCEDAWEESTRYLTAYNPNNRGEYIQLQIEGSQPWRNTCITIFPAFFGVISPSASGITIPMMCLSRQGWVYRSDWNQDGWDFRLISQNAPLAFHIQNLDMFHGGMSGTGQATTNYTYKISPTQFSLKQDKVLNLELAHTNLCRSDGSLREQIGVVLGEASLKVKGIKEGSECVLNLEIKNPNLKPGKYQIRTTINGLTQQLDDIIEITP